MTNKRPSLNAGGPKSAMGPNSTADPKSNPLGFLADEIEELKRQNLYRPMRVLSSPQAAEVVVDGRELINLSSNNYLGLATHPKLKEAALAATPDFGVGSGAVRTIAGDMTIHERLETELAAFKHTEAVLTFQSGFTANTGVIPVVTGEADLIVSDALNHASIIDGMRMSKAPRVIYPHKDTAALRELLREAREKGRPDAGGAPPEPPSPVWPLSLALRKSSRSAATSLCG
jgi:glycine C-acetyltransferase